MSDERENPYRSPQSHETSADDSSARLTARKHLQTALLILLVPTLCNWAAVFVYLTVPRLRFPLTVLNAVGLLLLLTVFWFGLLPAMEAVAGLVHRFSGRLVSRSAWFDVVYRACLRMPRAAVVGAMLWLAWLALHFLAGRPGGLALDVVFQVAANIVGAWVYLPIFLQWYHLHQLASMKSASPK